MDNKQYYRIYLCSGTYCRGRGSPGLYQHLEQELWTHGLDATVEMRSGGCQDQCDYGPNMIIWPGPWRYAGLTAEAVTKIVEQHIIGGEPVEVYLATPEMRR